MRLGKRKDREEAGLSEMVPRARPTTINPAQLNLNMGSVHHNAAPVAYMGQSGSQLNATSTDRLRLPCSPMEQQSS